MVRRGPERPQIYLQEVAPDPNQCISGLGGEKSHALHLFIYLWSCCMAPGILVPQPGIKPITLQWKHRALPTCTGCKWRAGDWQQEAASTAPQPAQHPRPTQHPHPAEHLRDPHCVNRQEGVSLPLTVSEGTKRNQESSPACVSPGEDDTLPSADETT